MKASFRRSDRHMLRVALLLAAAVQPALAQTAAPTARMQGEGGLHVWERADSVHVQWITSDSVAGTFQASSRSGKLHHATSTPPGFAHHTVFRKPRDGSLILEYGGSSTHRTAIAAENREAAVTLPHSDSLYVIADTHGEFDSVMQLLRNAGLIDEATRWSGARKHIVFLGDVVDRGPDVTRLLWTLYRLEREAHAAGGGLHVLLGNHEIMVMLDDLRYVHANEMQLATLHGTPYHRLLHPRESVLGRWLATKPPLIKAGDLLLVHGGVSREFAKHSPQQLARMLSQHMRDDIFLAHLDTTLRITVDSTHLAAWQDFFWGERSLFWNRSYLESDTVAAELDHVLRQFGAAAMVVGHTPVEMIHARFDGRLIVAHPRQPAGEMLLIVGPARQRRLYRLLPSGPPQPVPTLATPAGG
ncbi:MAG TPA: metallophosphoesterase [Longimicrobiales bacterium]